MTNIAQNGPLECNLEISNLENTHLYKVNTDLAYRAKCITHSSKHNDCYRGVSCDLVVKDVLEIISIPCIYCGEDEYPRTLDRIDNEIGHMKSNVVSACGRCNFTRGNMPYDIWLRIAPGMRRAREKGLFGEWRGKSVGKTKVRKL